MQQTDARWLPVAIVQVTFTSMLSRALNRLQQYNTTCSAGYSIACNSTTPHAQPSTQSPAAVQYHTDNEEVLGRIPADRCEPRFIIRQSQLRYCHISKDDYDEVVGPEY